MNFDKKSKKIVLGWGRGEVQEGAAGRGGDIFFYTWHIVTTSSIELLYSLQYLK